MKTRFEIFKIEPSGAGFALHFLASAPADGEIAASGSFAVQLPDGTLPDGFVAGDAYEVELTKA